jgi:hypothetical protein
MLSMQKLVETHFLSESKRGHLIMKTIIIQEHSRHKENIEYRECMSLKRAFEFHGHEASVWGLAGFMKIVRVSAYSTSLPM